MLKGLGFGLKILASTTSRKITHLSYVSGTYLVTKFQRRHLWNSIIIQSSKTTSLHSWQQQRGYNVKRANTKNTEV